MSVTSKSWGKLSNGGVAELFTLRAKDVEVYVTNYGAVITHILTKDRNGRMGDIALGFDTLKEYEEGNDWYFGCVAGRYANRIADGRFSLDGKTYKLAQNNGSCSLHGGVEGFNKKLWTASCFERKNERGVKLTLVSPDGEEGYPGNLTVTVIYTLNDSGDLDINYEAITDKATVLNLTNHTYFNLSGLHDRQILDHYLEIAATKFTPYDENCIPSGELRNVEGTPFDFTTPKKIGQDIESQYEQIQLGRGLDHNFCVNGVAGSLRFCAQARHPGTGRILKVFTTEPGVQLYTGNWMDGSKKGKRFTLGQRVGFCLETQHFPNSPNTPSFPSTVLRPGQKYTSQTRFSFGVDRDARL